MIHDDFQLLATSFWRQKPLANEAFSSVVGEFRRHAKAGKNKFFVVWLGGQGVALPHEKSNDDIWT